MKCMHVYACLSNTMEHVCIVHEARLHSLPHPIQNIHSASLGNITNNFTSNLNSILCQQIYTNAFGGWPSPVWGDDGVPTTPVVACEKHTLYQLFNQRISCATNPNTRPLANHPVLGSHIVFPKQESVKVGATVAVIRSASSAFTLSLHNHSPLPHRANKTRFLFNFHIYMLIAVARYTRKSILCFAG